MRTPAEEAEFQQLGTQLGFFAPPAPQQDQTGFLGFTGQTLANIAPQALSHIVQPAQTLLGAGQDITPDEIPNFFDRRAPQTLAEKGVAIGGELASYLPAIALTEGAAAEGLGALGMGARAAKIGGAAAGFAYPSAPEGPEAAAAQGAAGGLFEAAKPLGWRGRLVAGLAAGGIGYYEGQKQSPEQGLLYGALNLAGPTVIDPLVGKLFGHNQTVNQAGAASAAAAPTPHQPTGSADIMQNAFEQMTPSAKQAYLDATMGRSGPSPLIGAAPNPEQGFFGRPTSGQFENAPNPILNPPPAPRGPISFNVSPDEAPPVTGLQLGQGPIPQASNGGIPFFQSAPDLERSWTNPDQSIPPDPNLQGTRPAGWAGLTPNLDSAHTVAVNGNFYGSGTHPYDAFLGIDKAPNAAELSPVEQAAKNKFELDKLQPPSPPSRVQAPTGSDLPKPIQEGAHVMSSAVKQGNKILVGSRGNAPHEQIGIEHDLTTGEASSTVPEEKRGFLVQNADGTQGFANRTRAAKIAFKAGQMKEQVAALKSEDPWSVVKSPNLAEPATPTKIEAGTNTVHWNEQGMPMDVVVSKVEDNIVHYTENDFMKGQTNEKVATLQQFEELEKHPSDRAKAEIKNPPEPVEPAAPKAQAIVNPTLGDLKSLAKKLGVTVEEDKANTTIHIHAPEGAGWDNGTLTSLVHPYGSYGSSLPEWRAEGIKDAYTRLSEMGAPEVASLPKTSGTQVQVKGKYGFEPATIISREGKTLHVQIDDPVFGKRVTSVLESDTLPLETSKPTEGSGTVPFKDIPGAKNQLDRADERYGGEGGMLASENEEVVNDKTGKVSAPKETRQVMSVEDMLKTVPPEAAKILGEIINRVQKASGHEFLIHYDPELAGKGGFFKTSGRIGINSKWIDMLVKNWDKMSPESQANSMMRVIANLGHEISHAAHTFGERTGLQINGKPLTRIVIDTIDSFTAQQREYIQSQIKAGKGELGSTISKYLSGDIDAVLEGYKKSRPNITLDEAKELAAGEVLAEISSIELVKRMQVDGLPDPLRAAIDKFKQVIVNVVNWFRGKNQPEQVAALQSLSSISNKMFDHFSTADTSELGRAFPKSELWAAPKQNPVSSGVQPSEAIKPFLASEMARLGVRAAIGGTIGGIVGPTITGHELGTVESVIAGGVLGAFGPALAKALLNKKATGELIEAAKAMKGRPFAALQVLTSGKSLRELGQEAAYGWKGDGSFLAKVVRTAESELNINLDPKIKSILEQARGIMGEQFAIVEDALKKARWVKPSQGVRDATEMYIEGKIDKDQYKALLPDTNSQQYGQFMIAAREATSVASGLLASGMRKSALRDSIIAAQDKYVGRFYKAYKTGDFDMSYFDKVKQDFMNINPGVDIHNAEALLREHMVEIKANRKLFGSARGTGAQSIESKIQFRRRATEEEIFMQQQEVASLEHDPHSQAYQAANKKLEWMQEHKVTDNWRGWLGEIKDPTERMVYTFQKIYPSSIAGKIYDLLDNSLDQFGNKFAYAGDELTNARSLIKSEIAKGGDDVASLQARLKQLESYTPLPEGASYGKLSGKFTDRFVRDQISTYDTPYKWMDQSIIRGIAAINQAVKINRTVLNPLTAIRNYAQLPMFMLMARATPKDVFDATRVIWKGMNPELLSVMRQKHILGVDYAAQELTTNLGAMVSGSLDADLATRIVKQGYSKLHDFYQQPDMLQRAGAFISAQRRYAERMGLPPMDSRVIDAATDYTDRFTMNYGTVPRVVKAARQLPFVSLFVSYTSEITKILKNLVVDATTKGIHSDDRMHAIMALGAMAAIPALLTTAFESNLNKNDLADWKKLRALQPDYARSRFYLPTSRDEKGNFHYMDMTSLIPADSYTQMIKAALQGDHQAFVAANPIASLQDTPLLNIATEQVSGKDLRTGQSIQNFGRVKEVMKELLPPILPPGYEGTRIMNSFSPNALGTTGLTNLRTGLTTAPSDLILNYLTAIRMGTTNLASVQKTAMMDAQAQIAHEKQLMNDTVRMNVPNETRVAAYDRYTKSVTEIMAKMQSQMAGPQ